jgi:protein TonB
MEEDRKLVPDFDDLLFELRNKDYGAYQLRKRYSSVLITGIIVSSLSFSLAIIIPFIISFKPERIVGGGMNYVQVRMENLETPEEKLVVPPAPPPPEAARIPEIAKYVPPVVVDTILTYEEPQATMDDLLSQPSGDEEEVVAGTGNGDELFLGQDGSETDEPFVLVEVMPAFKGGDLGKFRDWVSKRTNYPPEAYENNIKGTVFLTFIVEKDGSVTNVTVLKGVDPLLDNEAVRAISESPKWSPGLQRGQPVRVRFQIPMSFMF